MTQLMLFSSLAESSSSYRAGGEQSPLASRYEMSSAYSVDNVQVKKDIRCTINGRDYVIRGFKYIESVVIWNYLYQSMLDNESNYNEFTWDEMCQATGLQISKDTYEVVLKALLKVSIVQEVRRLPFRFYRTFNALSTRKFTNGEMKFAMTLASSFCGMDPDFQQTLYRVLVENTQKSYSNPQDIEKIRNIARSQYVVGGQNSMLDIDASVVATA